MVAERKILINPNFALDGDVVFLFRPCQKNQMHADSAFSEFVHSRTFKLNFDITANRISIQLSLNRVHTQAFYDKTIEPKYFSLRRSITKEFLKVTIA